MAEGSMTVGGFELRNCVATGSTTQIWEVAETGGNVQLAMKLMLEESRKKPEMVAVLKHEFKVGRLLDHPSIIRFHKIEVNRHHAFFTMDYFRAPSLKTQITTSLAEVHGRFRKMTEALLLAYGHLHEKGWLHRDIKPDNILLNKTGEIRIIDFSLSCRIASAIGKLLGGKQKAIMGTRTYIPPEIILKRSPTIQSDIYSLGVTLYEALTGSPPFAGLSPNDLLKKHLSEVPGPPSADNPNVTADLDQIILKMLSKKPKDRYADMKELHAAFRNVQCFVEDPEVLYERRVKELKELETISVDKRLDSRADADRTLLGLEAPARPTKSKPKTAGIGELEPVRRNTTRGGGNQQQPMQPYGMPQPMMMQPMMPQPMMDPQMMHPQMMHPQMMHPQMMPPQMMPPQMMPPQMMPPQMMPPQMMPPQMMPPAGMQQMVPPQQMPPVGTAQTGPAQMMPAPAPAAGVLPQPAQPAGSQPESETAAAQTGAEPAARNILLPLERRSAQAARASSPEDKNLDFMTELPDVV